MRAKNMKAVCFKFWCFSTLKNLFIKKNNKQAWNCLDNLIILYCFLNLAWYGPICRLIMDWDIFVFSHPYFHFCSTFFLKYHLIPEIPENHPIFFLFFLLIVFNFTSLNSTLSGELFFFLSVFFIFLGTIGTIFFIRFVTAKKRLLISKKSSIINFWWDTLIKSLHFPKHQ